MIPLIPCIKMPHVYSQSPDIGSQNTSRKANPIPPIIRIGKKSNPSRKEIPSNSDKISKENPNIPARKARKNSKVKAKISLPVIINSIKQICSTTKNNLKGNLKKKAKQSPQV